MKPDTIYRWARSGRLGAVKLGKEWRIPAAELEAMIGRPVSRRAIGGLPGSPAAVPVSRASAEEGLERRLQAFVIPRDQILAVAADEASLDGLQVAFWRLAALSGARLVVTRIEARVDHAKDMLAREGLAEAAALVAAPDDATAREAVLDEARPGEPVWADYGALSDLSPRPGRIEAHARMVAAAALTADVTSLAGLVSAKWDGLDFDARLRLESHHRALAHVSPASAVFSRIR
jgi:hypothetical protein